MNASLVFFSDLGLWTLLAIVLVAFVTACIHGATGVAGGFLLAAAVAPIIGVKPVVPVVSVALLISHGSRALFNLPDFDRRVYLAIILPALPCIVLGALIYDRLPGNVIAVILGSVILASIPLRRWAARREIRANLPMLNGAGAVYGTLSGAAIGPGMILIPFMLGYGMAKEAFVATLAVVALSTNLTRVLVFGSTELLDATYFLLGVLAGLATIPGNWVGRAILRRLTSTRHAGFVDVFTVIGALNFFWLALDE